MNRERLIKIANGAIAALILFFSIRYILQLVPEITVAGIAGSLRQTPPIVMIAALGVTALNYLLVIGYDLPTTHQLRLRVPRWHISVVSLISFVLNNNLGLGALAGPLAGGTLLLLWYESHFHGGRFREIIKETFRTGRGPGEME